MYLRPEELHQLLLKCHKWIGFGCTITIETIDLKKVMQVALNETDPNILKDNGLVNIFGTPKTGPHRWGWMPDRLAIAVYRAGFTGVFYEKGKKKPKRDFALKIIK